MLDLEEKPRKVILVAVQLPSVTEAEFHSSLAELGQLARTLGLAVVGQVTQKRTRFDPAAYLGTGKLAELKTLVRGPEPSAIPAVPPSAETPSGDTRTNGAPGSEADRPEMILLDHEVSPSQARNLEKETGCEVLDRTGVILEIFHRHARSRAARAQVEIVRLEYQAPRLREAGKGKDRQRGGIGGKGTGESQIELDRRKIRDRIAELTEELKGLEAERKTQRARRVSGREQAALERIALVGYTNAGKSTLMRALTGSEVYVADKLFATLDTTVRTLVPETVPRILVSDTVGFIKNLPHGLVESFKSTLEEALEATLLCHVVDASDPGWSRQHAVTESVLDEIGAKAIPRLILFNKIDKAADETALSALVRARFPDALVMSAKRHDDITALRDALLERLSRAFVEEELLVPWSRQSLRGEIFASCQVLSEAAEDDGARFRCRAQPAIIERLRALLAA